MKHKSMLQAYRLLVPYGFDVDRDDLLILTGTTIPSLMHGSGLPGTPGTFRGFGSMIWRMVFICTTTTQHREMTIGKGWESCMLTST